MALRDFLPIWLGGVERATTTDLMRAGSSSIAPPQSRRQVVVRPVADQDEFGVSGTENFGGYIRREDFNPELDDFQTAVKIFEKMRRTDGQVRSVLQVIKLPLRGATWMAIPPEGGDPVDQQIADFINQCLFDDDAMTNSWDYVLRHILLQLDFGFSVLEKVWRAHEDGTFRLRRLAPRLPKTIREWHVHRDGSLRAVVQYAPVPHGTERFPSGQQRTPTYTTTVNYQYLTIPAEYVTVFVLEQEGDNYEGWSTLRTIYRNWWFKDQAYRVTGVGIDRWAVGIPVAELEEGHNLSKGELTELTAVLKAMRSHERAFLVAPPHVRFRLLPEGSRGADPNVMGWIDHHDSQMARNVLAGFLTMGRDPKGTLGFGARLTDMFVSSLNGVAKGISGDLKKQVVAPLCYYNFDMTRRELPTVICRDLEQVDLENLVNVLAKLTGTIITPDDDLESMFRKILKLPPMQASNSRKAKAEATQNTAAEAAVAAAAAAAANQNGQQPPPDENEERPGEEDQLP